MEIKITGDGALLEPQMRQYIERKLQKLVRLMPDALEFRVDVNEEQTKSQLNRYLIHMTVAAGGRGVLHGEERADSVPTAVDRIVEVMYRQIEHFKGKVSDRDRDRSSVRDVPVGEAPTRINRIAEVTPVAAKPMTVEEAVKQADISGQDLFMFLGPDTKKLRLLRRQKDGNYQLIEPELE